MADEYRVEVDLDDDAHGYSLSERLRALDLDDAARVRLEPRVLVSRDGPRIFLYTASEQHAREAERVMRSLVDEDRLSAEIRVTRWHPAQEDWLDTSVPLPDSDAERQAEHERHELGEAAEAELEGAFEWHVVAHLGSRDEAAELARRLKDEGLPVAQRWRYVVGGAVTEERAEDLAGRLRTELGDAAEVHVEPNLTDLPASPFHFLPF